MLHHDTDGTLLEHLVELRRRLLYGLVGLGAILVAMLPFTQQIYALVATPLMQQLPAGHSMIAIGVASPLLAPLRLVLYLVALLGMPWLLYQVWLFVAPALYRLERRLALTLLVLSQVLFATGVAFSYYIVFPLLFRFFVASAPEGVAVMTDIAQYVGFVFGFALLFGVVFQTPILVMTCIAFGVTTTQQLGRARPYIVVGCFAVAMIMTPPDVISQVLVALPTWLLFETGLLASRLLQLRTSRNRTS